MDQRNVSTQALEKALMLLFKRKHFVNYAPDGVKYLLQVYRKTTARIVHSAQRYAEHANRSAVVFKDIQLALADEGLSLKKRARFPKATLKPPIIRMSVVKKEVKAPPALKLFKSSAVTPRPRHIPKHLPPFPEPHTYGRTKAYPYRDYSYVTIREKAVENKLDSEALLSALLVAKESDTIHLFGELDDNFQVLAAALTFPAYLAALIPRDQYFDFDELEYHHYGSKIIKKEQKDEQEMIVDCKMNGKFGERPILPNTTTNRAILQNPHVRDNPYLRVPALPRTKKGDLDNVYHTGEIKIETDDPALEASNLLSSSVQNVINKATH